MGETVSRGDDGVYSEFIGELMCGICGIITADPLEPVSEQALLAMRESLAHRGPDDSGHYVMPGVALGSSRLAILDLSKRGRMPMSTPDSRYWIVHNGEIYNHRELRRTLETQGYTFRSNTDTEVLLYLYVSEGPAMLDRLNGMFAFAIWDSYQRRLFLARDRLGVKPLYYAVIQGTVYFASEEKALFGAGVPAQFDHGTWEELLCFRYVAGESTPFIGVRRLLPGHYLLWQDGKVTIRQWWNVSERAENLRDSVPGDPTAWYRETFDDAVNLRRIADVPVGVLLSGGLDSSSVAASLSRQSGAAVASFTVRFDEPDYDEGPLARQVAHRCNLDAHELIVPAAALAQTLRDSAWFNDEPLAHGNDLHLLAISRYAKPKVTVLLSGEGADETLGGYVRYQPLRYPHLLPLARIAVPTIAGSLNLNGRWRKLSRFLTLGAADRYVLFNACEVLPPELESLGLSAVSEFPYREQVLAEAQRLYPGDLARQAMYSDQHTFLCSVLDRNDRMTMGASIECRVPFLDYRLVETLAALPSSVLFSGWKNKSLLRLAFGERLPGDVLRHRKWGFGVPWRRYFRQVGELRAMLVGLPSAPFLQDSPINRSVVRDKVNSFLAGNDQPLAQLMQIFMIVLAWNALQAQRPKLSRGVRITSTEIPRIGAL